MMIKGTAMAKTCLFSPAPRLPVAKTDSLLSQRAANDLSYCSAVLGGARLKACCQWQGLDQVVLDDVATLRAHILPLAQRQTVRQAWSLEVWDDHLQWQGDAPEALREQLATNRMFVDLFKWLKFNLSLKVYSDEVVEFAELQASSPQLAVDKYRHFLAADYGVKVAFHYQQGQCWLQVETPVHLYQPI